MKHYKTNIAQAELADIEMYSVNPTDANLQNVANLFERATVGARIARPQTETRKPRILRVALTAALSIVMLFSVGLAASAEFREAVFGIFTATSTENVDDGLALDRFIIFEEAIADNQSIYVFEDVIYKYDDTGYPVAYYAYRDGGIVEIENPPELKNAPVEKNGEQYFYGQNVQSSRIQWRGGKVIFTEFINPHTGETIILDGLVQSLVISPDGEWAAYVKFSHDTLDNEFLIYNTQTEKTFSTGIVRSTVGEERIRMWWSLSWLADGVLAFIETETEFEEGDFVGYTEEGYAIYSTEIINQERSELYVFRIEERFLSAQ